MRKVFLKNFAKLIESYICRRLFFRKVEGCRFASCEFFEIFKNNYLVVHMQTAASDILRYPYIRISPSRSTLKKRTIVFNILVFIHFKLILESCTTSEVYLEPYQTSMMKLLAIVFSQRRSTIDIGSVAS